MPSRLYLTAIAVAAIVLALPTSNADACSIASDYADPPALEHAYDAQHAPASPIVVDAYISHSYASDGPGCAGVSSCGDIHGLNLVVQAAGDSPHLRITHQDGSVVYARSGWADAEGNQQLFLPGYGDVHDSMPFRIALLSEDGYPSLDLEWEATSQGDDDSSCSAAGGNRKGLSTSLLVLLGLLAWRRKRP